LDDGQAASFRHPQRKSRKENKSDMSLSPPLNSSRTLAGVTEHDFAPEVRARGERYFYEQTVTILKSTRTSLSARVQGGSKYKVSLKLEDDTLHVACDCPYALDVDPCKHIWAAILASDAQKLITPPPNHSTVTVLLPVDEDYEEEDDISNEFDEEEEEEEEAPPRARQLIRKTASNIVQLRDFQKPSAPAPASWITQMEGLLRSTQAPPTYERAAWPADSEIMYVVTPHKSSESFGLALEVLSRQPNQNGKMGRPKSLNLRRSLLESIPDQTDKQILSLLLGPVTSGYDPYGYGSRTNSFTLSPALCETLLPQLLRSGRCHLRWQQCQDPVLLQLDEGPPWDFCLEVAAKSPKMYSLRGALRRGDERRDLSEPVLLIDGGWVFWPNLAARLNTFHAFKWLSYLRMKTELVVPVSQGLDLLKQLFRFGQIPRLELPEELRHEQVKGTPRPRLTVKKSENSFSENKVCGDISFDYSGTILSGKQSSRGVFLPKEKRVLLRDADFEAKAAFRLRQLGFKPNRYAYYDTDSLPELDARKLPAVVRTLIAENWLVDAEGQFYRSAGNFSLSVKSSVDWFELHGSVDFGGATASFPALLAALKKGEDMVRLDDGSFGLLPEDWLKKFGLLANTGTAHDDHLRFTTPQAGMLDALLSAQPHATCDAAFERLRAELKSFDSIKAQKPPGTFKGQLRPYQQDGLGWLDFLRRFGFGGCLADDMGLGKTVQVLALLESRRILRQKGDPDCANPSLAVVPRSLIFNWRQEAMRFTPQLRVLDHTGMDRIKSTQKHFENHDLILTTYGTLRQDAVLLKDIQFDYVILDEAQAVKNSNTASAKAVRLMRGRHRLCMSGTPIENHLGELWSLFEFLNPGMLGAASVFQMGASGDRAPDEDTRALLARALRPFILRRTKAQVAKDLPQKTEQTLYCELDTTQRKLYDELRDHYRKALLGRIDKDGVNKSKIQILEALLRLRQAACHPGLIDKARSAESSAKLDALLPQVMEVLEENHKVLVFSQFTSLLSIVRQKLDAEKITYEYLDGKTRDREEKVRRFQNDPDCKLFLISLKAGGLGLNLTAAEYVFLLDPWWNPAVEAQAIDRAHRIGQTRPVFAYRLIARDTVEEKVLQLQETKRALADAIINADNSLIRSLTREDLELLLG
jgi:superfamily II DNA or RNA helicase